MEALNDGQAITLELSTEEARALRARLLQASAEGSCGLDDEILQSTLLELEQTLEYMDGVARVREQLALAGIEAPVWATSRRPGSAAASSQGPLQQR